VLLRAGRISVLGGTLEDLRQAVALLTNGAKLTLLLEGNFPVRFHAFAERSVVVRRRLIKLDAGFGSPPTDRMLARLNGSWDAERHNRRAEPRRKFPKLTGNRGRSFTAIPDAVDHLAKGDLAIEEDRCETSARTRNPCRDCCSSPRSYTKRAFSV
jgi:hypothetical protein